jgi:DUF971 family protein
MPNHPLKAKHMPEMSTPPKPVELRVSPDRRTLKTAFDNGESYALPAEMLRVLSPSAEVQGHSAAERKTVPGKRDVAIAQLVPTGNYAVRIVFSDGHDTGIFTWGHFLDLGRNLDERTSAYLAELAHKRLSRD